MTPGLTLLFAVAGGVAVGNLYYAQPLLSVIGDGLGVSPSSAGLLITLTQLGYVAGTVLLLRLGDIRSRHRLIPLMMSLSAVASLACAVAPNFQFLAVAAAAVGITTVAGQLLTPFAGDLADDAHRGRIVGTVASGLLTGVLGARIVGGLIGGLAGWRVVFVMAAALSAFSAVLLLKLAPRVQPAA